MKKVLVFALVFTAGLVFSQNTVASFSRFKNNFINKSVKPVFSLSDMAIAKTGCNFALQYPPRKPMFCRMEDKLHSKFNVWLQLRAGSDLEYRKLAFPESVDKKKSKLIE